MKLACLQLIIRRRGPSTDLMLLWNEIGGRRPSTEFMLLSNEFWGLCHATELMLLWMRTEDGARRLNSCCYEMKSVDGVRRPSSRCYRKKSDDVCRSSHIFGVAANSAPICYWINFVFMCVCVCGMARSTNGSRVLQFAADEIENEEFVESLRIFLDLPRMVPEIRLPLHQ